MASGKDLPGFYKDPATGRYFREKPGERNYQQLIERDNVQKRPELSNVVNFRIGHEHGNYAGTHSARKYYEMKLPKKTCIDEIDMNFASRVPIDSPEYIKGGPKSIFGLWNSPHSEFGYAIGETPHVEIDPDLCLGFIESKTYIQDICEVFYDTVVYIYNDFNGEGYIDLAWRSTNRRGYQTYEHFHSKCAPLYCCSIADAEFFKMAIGGENTLTYYNGISPVQSYDVFGRIMTTAFDETGTLIMSGKSDGFVQVFDTRCHNGHPFYFRAERGYERCLVDSMFLSEEKVVLTGVSNKLYIVDLRNCKPVTTFIGHRHSIKKSAISTTSELLCVNGADNVIRIWHISGGPPLHEIYPVTPETQIKGWLEPDANKNLLYYFENSTKKVYEI